MSEFSRSELESLTKDDIQDLLRDMGAKVSGNKDELIERVLAGGKNPLDLASAQAYNRSHAPKLDEISADPGSVEYAEAVSAFQQTHGLTVDGKMGPNTLAQWRASRWSGACFERKALDKRRVLYTIQRFEGRFDSCNRNGEYRGLFGKDHWAYLERLIGLSFGFIQFTQDGGSLGKLLKLAYDRHPERLKAHFKGLPLEKLIKMLGRSKKPVRDGRSPRVQPLAGADIWDEPWLSAFKSFGRDPTFQDVQVDLAIEAYLEPALAICESVGVRSERAVLMCLDRCIQMGTSWTRTRFKKYHDGEPEHLFLRKLVDIWSEVRWAHRPHKLFMLEDVCDGPMSW